MTLDALAKLDPEQSRIVELRFFTGLSIDETAEVLKTVKAQVKVELVYRCMIHFIQTRPDSGEAI